MMAALACDVLILGGGPAGSAAALTAARAGLHVILLERCHFPRFRPGETLHPGLEPLLDRLGVGAALRLPGSLRHPGVWIVWDGPERFEPFGGDALGPWFGFQVSRDDFDMCLLQAAMAAGVDVRPGLAARAVLVEANRVVGLYTTQGALHARYTIDAAGAGHRLARWLDLPIRHYSPPLLARFGYVAGACPVRDGAPCLRADSTGWTWTARVAVQRYHWTRLVVPPHRLAPGWRPDEFHGLPDVGAIRGANITWRVVEQTAGAGFFLTGDAAAVLDPAASHGVLRAIMTGMMAAHQIVTLLRTPASEAALTHAYGRWLADWFWHDVTRLGAAYQRLGLLDSSTFFVALTQSVHRPRHREDPSTSPQNLHEFPRHSPGDPKDFSPWESA